MSQTAIILLGPEDSRVTRSFIIVYYDKNKNILGRYVVPLGTVSPLAYRILNELYPGQSIDEPWFQISPYFPESDDDNPRTSLPEGMTDLYGNRLNPAEIQKPSVQLLSDPPVSYFRIRVYDVQKLLFEGIYTVDDLFLHGIHHLFHQNLLNKVLEIGDGSPFYYKVLPNKKRMDQVEVGYFPEDAYQKPNLSFLLPPVKKDKPSIIFKRIPDPPLPETDVKRFGPLETFGKGKRQKGEVYVPRDVLKVWQRKLSLSQKDEEGGYILGHAYRQLGSPEDMDDPEYRWIVEVTDIVMGEFTIGSPVILIFTSETWSHFKRQQDIEFPDKMLIGWFHTHLFPATDNFGLSGIDQDMHARHLTYPWQMAILLNFENEGNRTVRCYQRGTDGDLVETPYHVFDRPAKTIAERLQDQERED